MDYRLLIARRYLVSRKRVSLISVITGISVSGVTLGVAALVVVLSVMNGFYDFVRDLLVSLDPHVRIVAAEVPPDTTAAEGAFPELHQRGIADAERLVALARELPGVVQASPYVEGKALLLHDGSSDVNKVVIVRGVDAASWEGVSEVVGRTGFGAFDLERRDGRAGIVVGMSLGQRLALAPGSSTAEASQVALLSAPAVERLLTTVFGAPPVQRFEVRGLYELESVYDQSHVFIALEEAQRLFRMPERVSGVELRLRDIEQADEVKRALQARLQDEAYEVLTWYDLKRSLYETMRLEKWGASLILALIVVVAAFNIVGSLTMIVIEKRRDVGVLRAMGVSRKNIRRIFLAEGLLIGLVGTGAGLALGLGLALLQQHFELVPLAGAESFMIRAYPVAIQMFDLVLIASTALGLCVLAALYPAARAAAVAPAEAVATEG